MTKTHITIENAANYPAGTVVEFNYGAMYGSERGVVTGFETNQFGTQLTAVTDEGERKTISGFTNIGIGVYLIEVAQPVANKSSPWFMAA